MRLISGSIDRIPDLKAASYFLYSFFGFRTLLFSDIFFNPYWWRLMSLEQRALFDCDVAENCDLGLDSNFFYKYDVTLYFTTTLRRLFD